MEKEQLNDNIKEEDLIFKSSLQQQQEIEKMIQSYFNLFQFKTKTAKEYDDEIPVFVDQHVDFIMKNKTTLSRSYSMLDAGLPWFSYWILNAFDVFGMKKYSFADDFKKQFIVYLKHLQNTETGGFAGYSSGLSHIISNYAAVLAIVALDCEEAYDIIDRKKMKEYLVNLKNNDFKNEKDEAIYDKTGTYLIRDSGKNGLSSNYEANHPGTFQVHKNGESDLRSTYCGIIVAYILNILDEELIEGVAENIKKCQTFEGGLGPEPFSEAHGGYNFCGIATLLLINKLDYIDVNKMIHWLVNRQLTVEGGFQGRTNKLVDSCYSFWQGAVFNMLLEYDSEKFTHESELLYDQLSLQAYILMACQLNTGGIVDKPGKNPDLFHLNYAGTGLSLAQKTVCSTDLNKIKKDKEAKADKLESFSNLNYHDKGYIGYFNNNDKELSLTISSDPSMELTQMDPVFCLPKEKVLRAVQYFRNKDKK